MIQKSSNTYSGLRREISIIKETTNVNWTREYIMKRIMKRIDEKKSIENLTAIIEFIDDLR